MLDLSIPVLVSRVITLVIAFTVHEFSHAFVADLYGDLTPRLNHRLTLNPLKHLDVIGSLMLLIAGFGWAKPVPVSAGFLKQRSKSAFMWVSVAGPASNLLMAILAAIPLRFNLIPVMPTGTILPSPQSFLLTFFYINLLLMVFNLIPLSPLDGEKVLEFVLPDSWSQAYARLKPYGPMLLLVIVFLLPRFGIDILSAIMFPIINGLQIVLLGA